MNYKQIFAMILPIFVDNAFLVVMTMLNTAMISSSGVAAVSAVSMVDSLNIFLVNVFIAVATGGTVIVAQYKGSGNAEMVSKAASQAVTTVTIVSLAISALVILFHNPTLNGLFGSAEADVFEGAKLYLIGSCITFPFFAIYQAVIGVLRGVAETKVCLFLSVFLNLTNFVLNVVFIIVLNMGIKGLILSMILARVLGMAASIIYLVKHSPMIHFQLKHAFKLELSIIRKIMYIGIPFAAEQLFFNGGKLLTQTFIVQFGTLALTVNAISNALSMLLQTGASALSIAIVTVVGQCIGRGDVQDARKYVMSFMKLSMWVFIASAAIILPLFPLLVNMFSPPEEIISTIFKLILLISITQPILWTFSFVLPSALRAAGDSKFTSITALITMWLIRVILGYILGVTLGYGIIGVWIAMVVEWGVRGILFAWRFKGDRWYRHKLI
ncbi:MATE family efflux transporter [Marinicrinis lubricantis]|uniref:Probable multidrug resistance protein NorM n=1 Tax=Marinicrinis lubricantis TaxID=2086470 RepID=A0ABW1ILU6_9BACL